MNCLKLACFCLLMMVTSMMHGQEQFDRLFTADTTDFVGVQIIDNDGEGYYMLSVIDTLNLVSDSTNVEGPFVGSALNITSVTAKGDMVSRTDNYIFEDTVRLSANMIDMQVLTNGNLAFTATCLDMNDNVRTKVGVISADSLEVIWAKNIGSENAAVNNLMRSEVLALSDSSFVVSHQVTMDTGNTGLALTKLTVDGDIVWSNFYAMDDPLQVLPEFSADLSLTPDDHILVAGKYMGNSSYVMRMDTSGTATWSQTYTTVVDHVFRGMQSLQDSSIVLSIAEDNAVFADNGFIKLDYFGNIDTATVRSQPDVNLVPMEMVTTESGDIFVTGRYERSMGAGAGYYVEKVSANLNQQWAYSFPDSASTETYVGRSDIAVVADNTVVTVWPSVKAGSTFDIFPRIAKLDMTGLTGCEEEISLLPYIALEVSQDTLTQQVVEMNFLADIEVNRGNFSYNVTVLSLPTETFCPKDTNDIMFPLDATTEGAVSYEWKSSETGDDVISFDSIFIATKVNVMYSVEVKVEDEFCYTLCGSSTLTVQDPPMPTISLDASQYCAQPETKPIILRLDSNYDNIVWSIGDTDVTSITVFDFDTYSVTVTDNCMETGVASRSVTEADFPIAPIQIQIDDTNQCEGSIDLVVLGSDQYTDLIWNTGEMGPRITLQDGDTGNFTVEGLNDCLQLVDGERNIGDNDFYVPGEITSVEGTCDPDNNTIRYTAITTGIDAEDIVWTPGGLVGPVQVFEGNGMAIITANDGCNEVVQELTYRCSGCDERTTTNISEDVKGCLCFPNTMLGSADMEINKEFGPVNQCGNVTAYEMAVFNRWGKQVFSTDRVDEAWNGRIDNGSKLAPTEVYYFYARYTVDGIEFSHKGDITLLR